MYPFLRNFTGNFQCKSFYFIINDFNMNWQSICVHILALIIAPFVQHATLDVLECLAYFFNTDTWFAVKWHRGILLVLFNVISKINFSSLLSVMVVGLVVEMFLRSEHIFNWILVNLQDRPCVIFGICSSIQGSIMGLLCPIAVASTIWRCFGLCFLCASFVTSIE